MSVTFTRSYAWFKAGSQKTVGEAVLPTGLSLGNALLKRFTVGPDS